MFKSLKHKIGTLVISFIVALSIVSYVHTRTAALTTNANNSNVNVTVEWTIENVPITIVDSTNSKYVSGLPEMVTVNLNGPRNILSQLTAQNIVVQTSDLGNLDKGKHLIALVLGSLPSGVQGVVVPGEINVDVQPLVTKTVSVTPVVPLNIVADGYSVGDIKLDSQTVTLYGSQETLDKVDSVTVSVSASVTGRTESFSQKNIAVVVKDAKGNILDVSTDKTISVDVTITRTTEVVPVEVVLTGQQANYNYVVESQSIQTTQIAMRERGSVTKVNAIVDVFGMSVSGVVDVPIVVGDGLILASDKTVRVSVKVTPKNNGE